MDPRTVLRGRIMKNDAAQRRGGTAPASSSTRIPGIMDRVPRNHWMYPPTKRGRDRLSRGTSGKKAPKLKIPKPAPKRSLPEVAARLKQEENRLIQKDLEGEYFHPTWHQPRGILPAMSRCTVAPSTTSSRDSAVILIAESGPPNHSSVTADERAKRALTDLLGSVENGTASAEDCLLLEQLGRLVSPN